MKKSSFIIFILLTLQCFLTNSQLTAPYCYFLRIQFPKNLKIIPKINCYYKGKKLKFENDYCIIPEIRRQKIFVLFITDPENHPIVRTTANKTKYLKRIANKSAKLFYLVNKNSNSEKTWSIQEINEENIPLKIYEDAIVILLNPDFIDSIAEINENNFKETSCCKVINLPRIILKDYIEKNSFKKFIRDSTTASKYLDKHHDINIDLETKSSENAIISLYTC